MRKFFITEQQINQQFQAWGEVLGKNAYQQMKMLEGIVVTQEIKEPGVKVEDKVEEVKEEQPVGE